MNKLMKSLCIGILALFASFLLLVNSCLAQNITLSLDSGQGKPGETVNLSLNLSDSNSAASFQLTIEYDASVLENPTAVRGSSLISADKNLYTNTPSDGKLKLVAVGVNNNTIPSGQVAMINFSIKSDAPLGTTQLVLNELVASDADANNLTITGNGGLIEVVSNGGGGNGGSSGGTGGGGGSGGTGGGGGSGGTGGGGGSGSGGRQNCTDNDNDGYATGGDWCGLLDCDDSDPNIHPGATEVCNGKDDNCDGIIDNINGKHGIEETNCQCYGGNKPKQEECNGIDDDCNGEIDDNADCCNEGEQRECGPSSTLGVCKRGISTCIKGKWSECKGAVFPTEEICGNGKDDDCDGIIDEDCENNTCSNGIQDGDEEGIDCGGSCPNPCFDWSYLIISLIGFVILVVTLCFYFKLRKKTKEVNWKELLEKYQEK